MTINLNKKIVSKEGLLVHIQDIDVYRYYTGKEVKLKKALKSPLRDKDDNPSFGYFIGENNEICFNDYNLGGGDFVKFVQLKFGLNYFEALSKIVVDFNLKYHFEYKDTIKTSKNYNPNEFIDKDKLLSKVNSSNIGKKARNWKIHDVKFWFDFGIDKDILIKYKVQPISYVFINGKPILADKYAYCFTEHKDGKETYKIYQPYNKNYKWLSSHDSSVWQGWKQLPEKGEKLVITKSLKDVMSITNITNIPSVALQTESLTPKSHIVKELHDRFELIYLLYDNDFDKKVNWGLKFGKELANKFRFFHIYLNDKYKSKDFSDLVKKLDREKSKEILIKTIEGYMPF